MFRHFAVVYSAQDLNLQRSVAVKVLRREKANELNTRRFLREAALNGSLSNNPHVCTVHDFGRTRGGTLFIVMELLKGRPLNELLDERIGKNEPFTVLECIHLMSPVLRGLHATHTHQPPIVHRDLKPDNIWVNATSPSSSSSSSHSSSAAAAARPNDFATKIMDFGIAIRDDSTHETLNCGTRMYSSPEQTKKHSKLDGRSDIWSVGVILYQLLTLLVDVPFDPIDLLLSKGTVPPLSLHARTHPLSHHMESIVMKALQVDPANRWQTAEEMGDALHREEAALLQGWNRREQWEREATEAEAEKNAATKKAAAAAVSTTAAAAASTAAAGTAVAAASSSTSTSSAASASSAFISSYQSARPSEDSHQQQRQQQRKVSSASADSEPVHPRYQRGRQGRGGMFSSSSSEEPAAAPNLTSKL